MPGADRWFMSASPASGQRRTVGKHRAPTDKGSRALRKDGDKKSGREGTEAGTWKVRVSQIGRRKMSADKTESARVSTALTTARYLSAPMGRCETGPTGRRGGSAGWGRDTCETAQVLPRAPIRRGRVSTWRRQLSRADYRQSVHN